MCEVTLIQSSCHSNYWCSVFAAASYLLEFLHHLLDVEVGAVHHLILHLRQPLAQLLVLLIEDDPSVQSICDLLFTQRHLKQRGLEEENEKSFVTFRCLDLLCMTDRCWFPSLFP